jgi:hypothetical protein
MPNPLAEVEMLIDSLDEYVLNRETTREWDGKWHASALFSCERQATYGKIGTPESDPKDARTSRTFFLGHLFHDVVQTALRDYFAKHGGGQVYIEVPLAMDELEYASTADAVVHTDADDRWLVVEYKTVSAYGFKKTLPQEYHVMQARSYAMALRRHGSDEYRIPPLGDKLRQGVVVYICKDNLDIRLCWFDIDPAIEDEIANRMSSLAVLAKHNLLPPRLPHDGKGNRAWLCNYCRFSTRCYTVDPDEGEVNGL